MGAMWLPFLYCKGEPSGFVKMKSYLVVIVILRGSVLAIFGKVRVRMPWVISAETPPKSICELNLNPR